MEDTQFYTRVRRMKRIIVAAVFALILLLACLCAVLAWQNARGRAALGLLQQQLQQAAQAARAEPPDAQQPEEQPTAQSGEQALSLAYQSLYPELTVEPQPLAVPAEGTIYLTFDDGPSQNTPELLDVLDEYGVKATFFVVGNQVDRYPELLREIADRGHTIGVHSDCHEYRTIYASVEAFLQDFAGVVQKTEAITGQTVRLFRFPGGSINGYNRDIYMPLIAEMLRRGYVYHDWNVSAEDASSKGKTAAQIAQAVEQQAGRHSYSVALLHDASGRQTTVQALRQLIPLLQQQGYTFEPLDASVQPIIFAYD